MKIKKVLKITGLTLLTLIVLAFLIPIVFKKQVQALVKREINKQLNATVDFKDVKLSLFRHFPKATITIKGLTIIGKDDFTKDTLISADKIDMTAGLFSVLKGKDIKVYAVYLQSPRIHLLTNRFGRSNYDIAKASNNTTVSADTSSSAFKMTLKKYSISGGYLFLRDQKANTFMELTGLEHTGKGNLTADVFTLSTSTRAADASFSQDNIPYLFHTKTAIEADVKIDNNTNTYSFKTNDITLNNLQLNADGFIRMINGSTFDMDIKFKSPSNDFKDILSMIPAIYKKDFASIKTSGKAVFNGFVKGISSATQMPAYTVNLDVKDGSFQYPDLPKPVKNIQLSLKASNADGQPDNAVINITNGHLEMDNEPFDFRFIYKNPVTIEYIDAAVKGKLDLAQVTQFIKLDKGTKLAGNVWADAFAKGPMKALQTQSGNFTAGGFFDIKNLYYSDNSFPQPIQNGNIKATIENSGGIADNTAINISSGHIEVGKDPLDFSLQLRNPVSSVNFSGTAKGKFTMDNIKQFTTLKPGESISGLLNADIGFAGTKAAINQKEYDKIKLSGTAGLTNLKYAAKAYPTGITVSTTQLTFNPKNVTLSNLAGSYLGTNFTGTGTIDNLVGYAMSEQPLNGSLDITADKINLNSWMGTAENDASTPTATSATTAARPFLVPANINFIVHAKAQQVKYDKVEYNNISGVLVLNDEMVKLQNISTQALDGTVLLNGSYSTKINKKEPDIGLSYDIKDMDIQKAFAAFNTAKALMPIGKFLSGKLSSQLSLTGNLYGDMMPKLNSLSGKGNLLLLEGVLKKFAPLEKIASVLSIDRLKSISVKDIKNYIEFANGKVFVKPFTIKVENIEMVISGFHGFDQSIEYAIQMKLPRSVMGAQGNNFVNNLVTQANSKGIPLKLSETINLSIKMTGSIDNPSMAVNLKEVAGDALKDLEKQAKDFVKAKADSLKQKAKDSLNIIKEQVKDTIKQKAKEELSKIIDTAGLNKAHLLDSLKKRAKDSLKKRLIKGVFN